MAVVHLSFMLVGKTVPIDHGYILFSALCQIVPELHGDRKVGVQPIRGRQSAPGVLSLLEQSRLRIRLHSEQIAPYIAVAGKALDLEGHHLRVGIPQVEPLRPVASLGARLVTFRHAMDPTAFEADVLRELDRMSIVATPHFVPATRPKFEGQPMRRVIKVKNRRVIGYALQVLGLPAEESVRLQEEGLGGRRRMGCGVFTPIAAAAGVGLGQGSD